MTYPAVLLLSFVCVLAVGDWIAVVRGSSRLEYLCKPLAMVALVAVALALDPVSTTMRTWFVVALMLSLVGDVYLMLPRDLFVYGLTAFLGAHLAYIGGLASYGIDRERLLIGAAAAGGVVALAGLRIILGVVRTQAAMVVPVAVYMLVIGSMLAAAIGTGSATATIGASLFVISDSLIGWSRFVRGEAKEAAGAEGGSGKGMPLAIMVTYHAGQTGLVLSLATSAGIWAFAVVLAVLALMLLYVLDLM